MTSVLDGNVHNLAVDGAFDDCQDFVKALFGDADIKKTHKLTTINSINWARKIFPTLFLLFPAIYRLSNLIHAYDLLGILAQITYYFHAYASLMKSKNLAPGSKVRFVVPTGNFGDVLAGYGNVSITQVF